MKKLLFLILGLSLIAGTAHASDHIRQEVKTDYTKHLFDLYVYFHQNPELSFKEFKTAERLGEELSALGFTVTTGVGGTGIVAVLKNGAGPMVMVRADMDALPVQEKPGLPYASKATYLDPETGRETPVSHACGHDIHITSLVGTARRMAAMKDQWSGTLMLIGQPAEELASGAKAMMRDNLWSRFGKPDTALAFHVDAAREAGVVNVLEGSPFAGVDSIDIIVHGVGTHGASPHTGKDPILLASQIVVALQALVSREISPREPGVLTVGVFQAGTKRNIIPDRAHLQLTMRYTSLETRDKLINGIKRISVNMGRAAGLPEDRLPEVIVSKEENTPPTVNDAKLAQRLKKIWSDNMGYEAVVSIPPTGMAAEDFPYFTTNPKIPSVYFTVGGTPKADLEAAKAGGAAIPGHHSPLFKVSPEPAITAGIEATVYALLDLMPRQ